MTGQEIAARARALIGADVFYKLGTGNFYPDQPENPAPFGSCDCSGFVAFCGMYKRGSHSTDLITNDGLSNIGKNDRYERPLDIQEGDVVCYPGRWEKVPVLRRIAIGHCGIVTGFEPGIGVWSAQPWQWELVKVTHASKGNEKRFGHAIAETDGSLWGRKGGLVVRLRRTSV